MPLLRTFLDELRRQWDADTESSAVHRIRRNAAMLSVFGGLYALATIVALFRGILSWYAIPSTVLLLAGAVYGVRSYIEASVFWSRHLGKWAALCTAAGIAELIAVEVLT